jgi:hypothetical protein
MIIYCKTCKLDTIVPYKAGAACSWCDTILLTKCSECGEPILPALTRGRPRTKHAACNKKSGES